MARVPDTSPSIRQLGARAGLALLGSVVAILVGVACAESDEDGTSSEPSWAKGGVHVRVLSSDDGPVDSIEVGLRKKGEAAWFVDNTDSDGRLVFGDLSEGNYEVAVLGDMTCAAAPSAEERLVTIAASVPKQSISLQLDIKRVLRLKLQGGRERYAGSWRRGMQIYVMSRGRVLCQGAEDAAGSETQILRLPSSGLVDVLIRPLDGQQFALLRGLRPGPAVHAVRLTKGTTLKGRVLGRWDDALFRAVYRGAILGLTPDKKSGAFTLDALPPGATLSLEAHALRGGQKREWRRIARSGSTGVTLDLRK